MTKPPSLPLLGYLARNKLVLWGGNLKSPVSLDIPVNAVANLEVVSENELEVVLRGFIEYYALAPTHLVLILSDELCFGKELSLNKGNQTVTSLSQFTDSLPFEKTAFRIYPWGSNEYAIATNRELFDKLLSIFTKKGFSVDAVVPEMILDRVLPSHSTDLPAKLVEWISKYDSMKNYTIETDHVIPRRIHGTSVTVKGPITKRTILLAAIFSILLIALVFTFLRQ